MKSKITSLIIGVILLTNMLMSNAIFGINVNAGCVSKDSKTKCDSGKSALYAESEGQRFDVNEKIVASYRVDSDDEVVSFDYSASGMEVETVTVGTDKRIIAILSVFPASNNCELSLSVTLSSNETFLLKLYVLCNDFGYFANPHSIDSAYEDFFKYCQDNNWMTEEDVREARADRYRALIAADENIYYNNNMISRAANSKDTYIQGCISWKDDAMNLHRVRNIKIDFYDKKIIGHVHIGTTYTNDNGEYSFTFQNADGFWDFDDGGSDIFMKFYAGDDNSMVNVGSSRNDPYYYESQPWQNMTTGNTYSLDLTFSMTSDLSKAMQISQAIFSARDYATSQMGTQPSAVSISYPSGTGNCFYDDDVSQINISSASASSGQPKTYAAWDVIMHEYGHHVQNVNGIDTESGEHDQGQNLSGTYGKTKGMALAWSEAWASVFALRAQAESTYCNGILFAKDVVYDSYSFSQSLESMSTDYGDCDEFCVAGILWDMYDPVGTSTESYDTACFSNGVMWATSVIATPDNLTEFLTGFYGTFPSSKRYIGGILTYAGISPEITHVSGMVNSNNSVPLTVTWAKRGYNGLNYNDDMYLIFYDASYNEVLRIPKYSKTSHELSDEQNSIVYNSQGDHFYVAVGGRQIIYAPISGMYISEFIRIDKE